MNLNLPPRTMGEPLRLPSGTKRLVIIGANGAGKTRFTDYLVAENGDNALRVSSLHALYGRADDHSRPHTVEALYREAAASPAFLRRGSDATGFECLLAMLLNEEIVRLVDFKVRHFTDATKARLPRTKLDIVIGHWEEMFPGSRVLREGGQLLFTRSDREVDPYSQVRLSDGEKAVLYSLGAALYAPKGGTVFVENPSMFLHPTMVNQLWNAIEQMRDDCTFVYTTHDLEFAASRTDEVTLWVRSFDAEARTWEYDLMPSSSGIPEEIYMAILGARKPVMFIEGDGIHSIDARLYPLIFPKYTVKSLGSCNKVIEATRIFNDLRDFHHLESCGIVDRDRRDPAEVDYLRRKHILVPDVAEIENMLILEGVVRAVAQSRGKNPSQVFAKVSKAIFSQFATDIRQQALMHTRHRVKRMVEYRIDGRFTNINKLEQHIGSLLADINPRGMYEALCQQFHTYLQDGDYESVLRVYNQKAMVSGSNVAQLCGIEGNKDGYVAAIIDILRANRPGADLIRTEIRRCLGVDS